MSVSFSLRDTLTSEIINLSNSNAKDLAQHLGFELHQDDGSTGSMPAHELAVLCRRALMCVVDGDVDPEIPTTIERHPGHATFIGCGRPAGYLREKTKLLLEMCEMAHEGEMVDWY